MKKNILIVEDNEDVQQIYHEILGDKYVLYKAYTAKEGYSLLGKNKVDLIILDIILPKESGDTFLAKIKKDKKYKNIKVVCVTILTNIYEKLREIDPEITYIPKPFTKLDLLNAITSSL